MTLRQKLLALPPDILVVWCTGCGHVAATERLQDGDPKMCGQTIATGTPKDCIQAMCE